MLWMKIEFNLWSCAFKLSSFHVKVVLNLTSLNPILLLIYLTSCGKKKFINKILTEKQSFYILLFVCTCLIFLFHFLDNKIGQFVLFSGIYIYIYIIEKSVFIWLNKKKGFIDRFCALGPIFVLIFSLVKINKLFKKKKKPHAFLPWQIPFYRLELSCWGGVPVKGAEGWGTQWQQMHHHAFSFHIVPREQPQQNLMYQYYYLYGGPLLWPFCESFSCISGSTLWF